MIHLLKTFESTTEDFRDALNQQKIPYRTRTLPFSYHYKRYFNPQSLAKVMKKRLKKEKNPVVINGPGMFHHLTYGICSIIEEPFGYVHFDRHHDFGNRSINVITAARFVDHILADTNAVEALLIGGVRTGDHPTVPYYRLKNLEQKISRRLSYLPEQVYISVDLDVLSPAFFNSGYPDGTMNPNQLCRALELICREKKVIGGDICGYLGNDRGRPDTLKIALNTILKINRAVEKNISKQC